MAPSISEPDIRPLSIRRRLLFFLQAREENITRLPIPQAICLLAIPTSLRFMGHFLFELIDAFWLGKLGKQALAAVGGVSLYIWAYYSLILITTAGTNTLISQATGAGNSKRSLRLAGIGVAASCCCAVLFITIYLAGKDQMIAVLGLKGTTLQMGHQYFFPFILASPIYYLWCEFEEILNARGQTHTNLLIMIVAIGLNTILDPCLIHGYGPFPRWGVAGAQAASIISASCGLLLTMYTCYRRSYFRFLAWDWPIIRAILKIGLPRAVSDLLFCLTYVALAHIIQQFGEEALAAWMVCHRFEGFAFFLSLGFSTSTMVMVGQYTGAGKHHLVRKSVIWNLVFVSLILLVESCVLYLLGKRLLTFFSDDYWVLLYGSSYLYLVAITHIFLGWELVAGGAFAGIGNTLPQMYVVGSLTVGRIPFSCLLIPYFGIVSVFWVISLSTLFKGIIMVTCFFYKDGIIQSKRTTDEYAT